MTWRVGRGRIFIAIVAVCVLSAVVYAVFAARRAAQRAQAVSPDVASPDALAAVVKQPHLVFVDDASRHIAVAPLSAPDGPRLLTPLACERVYVAADHGLCLASNTVGTVENAGTYSFDDSFSVTHTYPELGLPSRVRLSAHGTLGATTVFVTGDSYNAAGLSTRTNLFDLQNGVELDDLENFSVYFGNKPFQSADFNFWGVTFASDDDEFYATLGTGGTTYLVHGNRDGHMDVVRENVECPSLSPDNTRIVFKERPDNNATVWRLAVLDLSSMNETWAGAEARSVDDQVEWLDNSHILYGVRDPNSGATDIWEAALDPNEPPRIFVHGALSPAAVTGDETR